MATKTHARRRNAGKRRALCEQMRGQLAYIAQQAMQARKLDPANDNLLDLIDTMDNDLQEVITLVNRVRRDPAVRS